MVKKMILVLFVIAALIGLSGMIGYTIGKKHGMEEMAFYQEQQNLSSEPSYAGIYFCENWGNHGEASLILNADGSCIYPVNTGDGCTWIATESTIEITIPNELYPDPHVAYIADNGLSLHGHWFEKK